MVSYKNRIKNLENRVGGMQDLVEIRVGVWRYDRKTGDILSGETVLVPKEKAGSYGVLLVPEPCKTTEEWEEYKQEQKQTNTSFCTSCGSYVHPAEGSLKICDDKVRFFCDNCKKIA